MQFTRKDFPEGFDFGVATSSYQIEGSRFGGAGRSQWDDFSATPGNTKNAENGATAVDHYHRFAEDFDLVKAANFDCYRFSLSWSRIMPDGFTVNPEGLDFYDRVTDALLERGIKPCATLYHWELPSALLDRGGWRNRDITDWFADYTHATMSRLGDRMHSVAPINEPWCVTWLSHFMGYHAPGVRDIRATARAMHHVLLAHGKAIGVMRGLGMKNLGAVFNFEWSTPADDSPEAIEKATLYDGIYNRWFLGGIFKGEYPQVVLDGLGPHMPDRWQDDFGTITAPVDWCGLNYYTRKLIGPDGGAWPGLREVEGPLEKTLMGWEIYPEGLYNFLTRTAREYTGTLPLIVTENGLASPDVLKDGKVEDPQRSAYIAAHLARVQQAIAEGIPVKGYYLWSLMDNFEWACGYEQRFGLVHVDFETLERTPKASYHQLAQNLRR